MLIRAVAAIAIGFWVVGCRPEPVPLNPHKHTPAATAGEVDRDVTLSQAPASVVHKRDGSSIDLAELWTSNDKKSKTVVVFYRGGWCPHCQKQLAALQGAYRKFSDANAVVIAISSDSAADATTTRDKLGLGFEVYSDPELAMITKWGVEDYGAGIAKPATFIVQPGGAISYRKVGHSPSDQPSIDELVGALQ